MMFDEQIKLLCLKSNISLSELARRLNKSPQSLCQKISRGTISMEDLEEMAIVTGCRFNCYLTLPSGEKIKIND